MGAGLLSARKRGKRERCEVSYGKVAAALVISCVLNVILVSRLLKAGADNTVRVGHKSVMYKTRTTRKGLEARPTILPGVPPSVLGLFTTEAIKKGDFIGFYCGDQYTQKEQSKAKIEETNNYVLAFLPGTEVVAADPTNERHIMGLANEPDTPERRNMEPVPYFEYTSVYGEGVTPVAVAMAYHATVDIEAGSEIFWYYGPDYRDVREKMGYNVEHVEKVYQLDKEVLQDPQEVLVDGLPQDCFMTAPKNPRERERFRLEGMADLMVRNVKTGPFSPDGGKPWIQEDGA